MNHYVQAPQRSLSDYAAPSRARSSCLGRAKET